MIMQMSTASIRDNLSLSDDAFDDVEWRFVSAVDAAAGIWIQSYDLYIKGRAWSINLYTLNSGDAFLWMNSSKVDRPIGLRKAIIIPQYTRVAPWSLINSELQT